MTAKVSQDEAQAIKSRILQKAQEYKAQKLRSMNKPGGDSTHFYDDDIARAMSEEFTDRVTVIPVLGDIIRFFGGVLRRRKELTVEEFAEMVRSDLKSKIAPREAVAKLTNIVALPGNSMVPFMNGGPDDENWDNSPNGFFDWITNKSMESILGVELGFKADDYGLEISQKLIAKKKANPDMYIGILVDGFVSILMQKIPRTLTQFEQNTISMLRDMRNAGIDVVVNSSSDPLSDDFLAANHIKLWIFDCKAAFFGGIGIESQFRNQEYDEMDLVQGKFVEVATLIALMLIRNQRAKDNLVILGLPPLLTDNGLKLESLAQRFEMIEGNPGTIQMKIRMDVPGYVQDAQKEYINLVTHQHLEEIYILVPYFSDHKVAKGVVKTATRLQSRLSKEKQNQIRKSFPNIDGNELNQKIDAALQNDKRIHVIFPTKQEDAIIADVSKYYSYYLRNNPIVDTRQFIFQTQSQVFNMLHAKQMVVILKDPARNWTKYVKYGGSYNPAGRAWNMWELNSVEINENWETSDEGENASPENPIKDYLNNVMITTLNKYTEPFPWGEPGEKLTIIERISMEIARHLWF